MKSTLASALALALSGSLSLMAAAACGSDDSGPEIDASSVPDSNLPVPDAGAADANSLITDRPYGLLVPDNYDGSQPVPLVLLLHGYGAGGVIQSAYFGFPALVQDRGFILAFPDGTIDQAGNAFWNATNACCDFNGTGVDDVAYLTAVLDDVQAQYNIDPKRVYAVGHSNGGFMSYRLSCDIAPRIAAMVSLAGATWLDPAMCQPSEHVSVLQVHGDMDTTIPYAGTAILPGAVATVTQWAGKDDCTGALEVAGMRLDLDGNLAGDETRIERFAGCPNGVGVELWTIEGGEHIPALTANWGPSIYDFLLAHPKP